MKNCLVVFVVCVVVFVGFVFVTFMSDARQSLKSETQRSEIPQGAFTSDGRAPAVSMTLRAAPGNGSVQMFDSAGAKATAKAQFPNGTSCTKVRGPFPVRTEGISMSFYMLTCNGTTGYVNAKWVQ